MTISRVKPAGWGIGDKLTSAEQNAVDTNATYALDKRAGETDTLESVVSCSGAGRVIQSVAIGANADTTYLVSGGNSIIRLTGAITANRAYTLSATGAQTGDMIFIFAESTFNYEITVKDQAAATLYTVGGARQWASFMYAGGWRLFQGGQGGGLRSHLVTAAGASSFTVPSGVSVIQAFLVGGGGGGGGGGASTTGAVPGDGGGGGGGGGGGRMTAARLAVTAGDVLTLTVGAGGSGGAGSTSSGSLGSPGTDGGDSTITGTAAATARGGQAGLGGALQSSSAASYVQGGNAVRDGYRGDATSTEWMESGRGGFGLRFPHTDGSLSTPANQKGQGTAAGAGGAGGARGASTGTGGSDLGGGGGGGGGGASEWNGMTAGAGGAGGNGDSLAATPGSDGADGTLGAGGGGGGGAGADFATSEQAGGNGGNGGDGAILLLY